MLRFALLCALFLMTFSSAPAFAETGDVELAVPYRGQLDGTPYASANCGPTSVAMVLEAFGVVRNTHDLRMMANKLQGTWGRFDGIAIEHLATLVVNHGLHAHGLWQGQKLHRWTLEEARAELRAGRPIIPQVWYRALPGRWESRYQYDHYIVLVGTAGEDFIYHDPIDDDYSGVYRRISAEQLTKAWRSSDVPWGAFAVGPAGESPLKPQPKPVAPQPAPVEERMTLSSEATEPARSLVPNAPWRVIVPPERTPTEPEQARGALSNRGGRPAVPESTAATPQAREESLAVSATGASTGAATSHPGPQGPLVTLAIALRYLVGPVASILG